RHSRDELPESFAHDPAGNLLMQDRPGPTRIKGNRLLMQGDRHYDYDAFGNLIRERRGRDQLLITEYRYDCQHRLIGLTRADGQTASYQYDAFGRRIRKTVDGQTTEFFWQGDHLVAESSKTHHRSYVYEPGTFRPLALLDGKGPKRACPFYYQLDHLGTPQELTDYSGEIVWSAQYDAYGKVSAITLAGEDYLDQPLRFQGQYFDAESGLHYNRHRYYDPRLGRYLTPDPIKLAGGLNQYQYVPNPTGWVDPLGLSCSCPPTNPRRPMRYEAGRVVVEEGSPPLPKMTAQERRARLDEVAEENAKRRVYEYENLYGMHTVKKHSSEISDPALKQRGINGADPHTGIVPRGARGNLSSQFHNWRMHLGALNKAMTKDRNGLIMHTGRDHNNIPIVKLELPGAGRGYRPNRRDQQNPTLNEDLNWFEVKFDQINTQKPFTGFPAEGR
ncbi:RHS repeat domain-containing protein, partial [Pseudomonas sp. IT-93MI4]|uniref:RHS repeat domain-containing protein n=1 Tax=Pseudomonas sp. IT-93MI4 TaxID=3026441 RepID=UPI0039E1C7B0